MEKEIKPYYRRKNRAYYRHGSKRMIIEREATGIYNLYGQIITDVKIKNPFTNQESDIKFPTR